MSKTKEPLFETRANATLKRVTSTFGQRGTEYGDTWANAQWLNMKAVASKFALNIDPKYLRVLAAAALCDVKYQRMEGGYKDDTVVDRIAYDALFAAEVESLMAAVDVPIQGKAA